MDALWAQRATPGSMDELISVGSEALASDPNSYELRWRVGRANWWIGRTVEDKTEKAVAYSEGIRYGRRAIHLKPDGIEGRYIYAVSLGGYAENIGVVQALRENVREKVERGFLDLYAMDPDYGDGTAPIALGRFYYMLPWPLRDLNASRRYLEEARRRHPRALWGRLYLGETYYALGQERAAKAELHAVLALDPLPEDPGDESAAKAAARDRLVEWYGGSE